MTPKLVTVSEVDLLARRDKILRQLDMTDDELRHAERERDLTGLEWQVLEQVNEIDFLLGHDRLD